MSRKCFEKLGNKNLTDRFDEKVKSGLNELEAGELVSNEYFKQINSELSRFKKSLGLVHSTDVVDEITTYEGKLKAIRDEYAKKIAELEKVPSVKKPVEQPKQEIKPIRQLGTGSNVYYETDKLRVNEYQNGNYILNISDNTEDTVPIINVKFDDVNEAVKVAERINKIYPNGVPRAVLIDRVVEDIRKEINAPKKEKNYGNDNKIVTSDRYEELKKKMLGKRNNLSSGIDPEMMAIGAEMAVYHFEAGARKFNEFSKAMIKDLGDWIAPYLKSFYEMARYMPQAESYSDKLDTQDAVKQVNISNLVDEINVQIKKEQDVLDRPDNSQRDRQDTKNEVSSDQKDVSNDRGTGGQEGNGLKKVSGSKNKQSRSGKSGLDDSPTLFGEPSNNEIYQPDETIQPALDDAGNIDGRGRSIDSPEGNNDLDQKGSKPDSGTTQSVSGSFAERVIENKKRQVAAESIKVKLMDADNIRETLPFLLPEQQDDVIKAEERFFSDTHKTKALANGKGFLFTNGTGTGKTYTGLGIAKRFVKMGKNNILIVTPSQPKVTDWARDGKNLGLDITPLDGTSDKGTGIVITTFANFRANQALKERDFDLIIYDESHRIMEASKGKTSSTTFSHFDHSNVSVANAFGRITDVHPLWMEHKNVFQEWKNRNVALNNDQSSTPEEDEAKVKKLSDRIDVLKEKMKEAEPALRERAKKAVENTKVVFLSATPFKEHFNLKYANGILFDWGGETTYEGHSRVDPESRFYLDNFGSAYTWRYHQLQQRPNRDDNAVAMQEIEFSKRLMREGVMSGRAIESDQDYERVFPKVPGLNSELINDAYSNIFNYETNEYSFLRNSTRDVFHSYEYTTQLLEALKASTSISRIQKHLDLGRKVVIFHRRQKSEVAPPFQTILYTTKEKANAILNNKDSNDEEKQKAHTALSQVDSFRSKYADLLEYEQTLNYNSAVNQVSNAFGDRVVFLNGSITSSKIKSGNIAKFNTDNSGVDIIMVQEDAGKEGISLHDTTGKHQRVLMSMSMPISSTTALQIEGRIFRIGQESDAIFEYPLLGLDLEISHFAQTINKKLSTTENLAIGDQSRDLIRSFSEGVLFNSTTDNPNKEQGKGGKEYDKRELQTVSMFQKAIMIYNTNSQKRGRRDQREGTDYYATPEPLGQKMVQWADLKEFDSAMEPSAGHGAIAMWVPNNVNLTAIEPSVSLYSKLTARAGGTKQKIINSMFEDYNIINKYNGIIMNPPFGQGGSLAIKHIEKAFAHLKEGGRIVALIPNGGSMQKHLDKFLYGKDEKDNFINPSAVIRAEIELPSVTFEQAGTKVNTKIVIIDKISDEETRSNLQPESKYSLPQYDKIKDFFDEIEFIDVPSRVKVAEKQTSSLSDLTTSRGAVIGETKPSEGEVITNEDRLNPVAEYKHTQTGEILYNVQMKERLEKEEYYKLAEIAKKHSPYNRQKPFSIYSKGFLFKSKEDAIRFKNEADKNNTPLFRKTDPIETIQELQDKAINPKPIVYFDTVDDLPNNIKNHRDFDKTVQAVNIGSMVFVVKDKLKTRDDAIIVWIHEVGVHGGIRNLIPNNQLRQEFLDHVWKSALKLAETDPKVKAITDKVSREYSINRGDEFLAYYAEKITNEEQLSRGERNLWNSILDKFNEILDKLYNFSNKQLFTRSDIHNIILASIKSNFNERQEEQNNPYKTGQFRKGEQNNNERGGGGNVRQESKGEVQQVFLEKYGSMSGKTEDNTQQGLYQNADKGQGGVHPSVESGKDSRFRKSESNFYSTVEKALENIQVNKATPYQWKAALEKNGAKQAELDWMDWDGFVKEQRVDGLLKKTIDKEAVRKWIDGNKIEVQEIEKGVNKDWASVGDVHKRDYGKVELTITKNDEGYYTVWDGEKKVDYEIIYLQDAKETADSYAENQYGVDTPTSEEVKFSQYQEPGGENYKELLLTLPGNPTISFEEWNKNRESWGKPLGTKEEYLKTAPGSDKFKSSHFDEPNIIAHIRFNERTDVNGNRVLFVEEFQSDWAQKGKKEGFKTKEIEASYKARNYTPTNDPMVPNMPFKQTPQWVNLLLRRMLKYAADNGFDAIAWTNGEMQAARYDLSKSLDEVWIQEAPRKPGYLTVTGYKKNEDVVNEDTLPENLSNIVGKELSEKYLNNKGNELNKLQIYSGLDLKVGGEGMKAFYDQIVPTQAKKVGKPFGATVGTSEIIISKNTYEKAGDSSINMENGEVEKGTKNNGKTMVVQSMNITDDMRGSMPMFRKEAFHGSPHSFDKFDTDHIGSGEGAQAYGWGLYFTDKKSIAEEYARKLANKQLTYKGEKLNYVSSVFLEQHPEIEEIAAEVFKEYPQDAYERSFKFNPLPIINDAVAYSRWNSEGDLLKLLEEDRPTFEKYGYWPAKAIDIAISIEFMKRGFKFVGDKNLYKVKIYPNKIGYSMPNIPNLEGLYNVYTTDMWYKILEKRKSGDAQGILDNTKEFPPAQQFKTLPEAQKWMKENQEYDYLRWDKQITNKQLQAIVNQSKKEGLGLEAKDFYSADGHYGIPSVYGGDLVYRILTSALKSDKEASLFLLRAGIDGVQYPTQFTSQGSHEDKFNYVVFDANEVEVEEHIRFRKKESTNPITIENEKKAAELRQQEKQAKVMSKKDRIGQFLFDNKKAWKNFQERIIKAGGVVTDKTNAYVAESLSHSRVLHRQEQAHDKLYIPLVKTIAKLAKKTDSSFKDIANYLVAKHSIERNLYFINKEVEALRDKLTGENSDPVEITLATDGLREKIMAEYEAGTYSKAGVTKPLADEAIKWMEDKTTLAERMELHKQVEALSDQHLDYMLEYHIISRETYDKIKKMYNFYVPLRGWDATADSELVYRDSSNEAFAPSNKKAEGRTSFADDPIANLMNMLSSVIVEGEKNNIKLHAKWFLQLNKNLLKGQASFRISYKIYTRTIDGSLEEIPDVEYFAKSDIPEEYKDATKYKIGTVIDTATQGLKTPVKAKDHEVKVYEGGELYVLQFNDPEVALALNNKDFSALLDKTTLVMNKSVGKVTRYISAMVTSRNPAFVAVNAKRDYGAASIFHYVHGGAKQWALFQKNYIKIQKALLLGSDLSSSNEIRRAYALYKNFGGETGLVNIKDVDSIKKEIESDFNRFQGSIKENAWHYAGVPFRGLEQLAAWSENMSRFATFMTAKEMGLSNTNAAYMAKSASINFNKKGRISGIAGSLYAFFNASMQAANLYGSLWGVNSKRMTFVHLMIIAKSAIAAILMENLYGGDDDDELLSEKITPYTKYTNWLLPIGDDTFLKNPQAQGYRVFESLGTMTAEIYLEADKMDRMGLSEAEKTKKLNESIEKKMKYFVGSIPKDFSPIDANGFITKEGYPSILPIIPSAGKPIAELVANKNFMDNPIYGKSYGDSKANSQRYFNSINPVIRNYTDKLFVTGGGDLTAKSKTVFKDGKPVYESPGKLKEVPAMMDINPEYIEHLISGYFGGFGTFTSQTVGMVASILKDEEVLKENIPIVNRFIGKANYSTLKDDYYTNSDNATAIKAAFNVSRERRTVTDADKEAYILATQFTHKKNLIDKNKDILKAGVWDGKPLTQAKKESIEKEIEQLMREANKIME